MLYSACLQEIQGTRKDRVNTELFVEWLQTELDKRGWDRAELSRRSGISQAQLTHIFKGTRGIGSKTVVSIARGLGVPEADVYRAAGLMREDPSADPEIQRLVERYKSLPPDYQRMVDTFLTGLEAQEEADQRTKRRNNGSLLAGGT